VHCPRAEYRSTEYGGTLEVQTRVEEWREKTFVMKHEIRRNGGLLAEAREIRFSLFATQMTSSAPRPCRCRRIFDDSASRLFSLLAASCSQ
jgi:4-hydroxybenzoyl-CoA thioesterase